ncbi:hypothetical protein HMPREF9554_02592 [Treponema phagedenis F0421]|nr:hypothetical protein HMPREF9554_02592 [Treponema phagedenis F0421]
MNLKKTINASFLLVLSCCSNIASASALCLGKISTKPNGVLK